MTAVNVVGEQLNNTAVLSVITMLVYGKSINKYLDRAVVFADGRRVDDDSCSGRSGDAAEQQEPEAHGVFNPRPLRGVFLPSSDL